MSTGDLVRQDASPQEPQEQDASLSELVAGLRPWQQRYLLALESGSTEAEALSAARVSAYTLRESLADSVAFARAHTRVLSGYTVTERLEAREVAQAHASGLLMDAIAESRAPELLPRDRLGNRRLVLEVAGAVGTGAQKQGAVAVQVNVYQDGYSARLRAAEEPDTGASD